MKEAGKDPRAAYDAWHSTQSLTSAEPVWHRLVKGWLPSSLTGVRLLEIGCGDGRLAVELARRGAADVVAADFSPVAVAETSRAAERAGAWAVHARVQDIQRLTEPSDSFDVVVSCETIEHVRHPPAAVAELARVLKPGGTLLLTTPNYLGTMGLYRAYRRLVGRPYTEEGQPITHLTLAPRTWWWLRRAGLRVEEVLCRELHIPVPGRSTGPLVLRHPAAMAWVLGFRSFFIARKPGSSDRTCLNLPHPRNEASRAAAPADPRQA